MRTRSTIVAILLAFALWAQPSLPDTPAGRQFARWLVAFNRGEPAALKEYLEKNYPEEAARLDQTLGFRERTGGFELKKVEKLAANRLTGVVKERDSSTYARFELEVEPSEPHRITDLRLNAIARPQEFATAPRLSEQDALAALKAEIERVAARDRFAGEPPGRLPHRAASAEVAANLPALRKSYGVHLQ